MCSPPTPQRPLAFSFPFRLPITRWLLAGGLLAGEFFAGGLMAGGLMAGGLVTGTLGGTLLMAEETLPRTGPEHEAFTALDELLEDFLRQEDAPGVALAVSRHGRLVYGRGFGFADREAAVPVQPDSLFRIASISKPITAVAILQLVEQGQLQLDDLAYDHLPPGLQLAAESPPSPLGNVTVRHLLQHRGGWDRDASFDAMFKAVEIAEALGTQPPAGPREVIRYMHRIPLDFAPGTDYAYSNFGYCLLGRIVEAKTGKAYDTYVREAILEPLGIRTMRIGRTLPELRADGEVRYHDARPGQGTSVFAESLGAPVPRPYGAWHVEAMDAHGGWIASAPDLVRFASAFDDPDACPLLTRESIATMWSLPGGPEPYLTEGEVYYALGWLVRTLPDGQGINTWHTGSLPGTSTLLVRRHDGMNWAILFNTREAKDGSALARKIDPLIHQAVDRIKDWPAPEPAAESK